MAQFADRPRQMLLEREDLTLEHIAARRLSPGVLEGAELILTIKGVSREETILDETDAAHLARELLGWISDFVPPGNDQDQIRGTIAILSELLEPDVAPPGQPAREGFRAKPETTYVGPLDHNTIAELYGVVEQLIGIAGERIAIGDPRAAGRRDNMEAARDALARGHERLCPEPPAPDGGCQS